MDKQKYDAIINVKHITLYTGLVTIINDAIYQALQYKQGLWKKSH